MLPFKPQVAVGIVLEHEEPVALGELQDPLPFFQTGGDARGVLEIGDQVEEFDVRLGFERLFQRREIDPVLFQRHADQPRAEGFDGIERAHKKLGDSHSTTSPGLHSTLATSSMACWAPLVIRSSSNARPIPCFCFRYALRRSRSGP